MPQDELAEMINKNLEKTDPRKGGRPRVGSETMLRMYFLSQRFNLSDTLTEENIYDRLSFQHSMNIDVTTDQVPDSTTLSIFRHFLEEKDLGKEIMKIVNHELEKAEIILTGGKLVDATIIKAPSSTKNKSKARDPEMSSTKKRGSRSFGAKVHIGTDEKGYIKEVRDNSKDAG